MKILLIFQAIVHETLHLRYGVHDEYNLNDTDIHCPAVISGM